MELSLGPFLTCCMITVFLTLYFYITLYHRNSFSPHGKKMVFTGIMLIFIRMAIPLNLPFTYTLYSYNILPRIIGFLYSDIPGSNYSILNALCIIWIIGAVIQLCRLFFRHVRLNKYIRAFYISEDSEYSFLFDLIQNYTQDSIKIAVLPFAVSPSITGLQKPVLILPDIKHLSEQELKHICAHEIAHYTKHDLWLLLLIDIVCCIHWWNPMVYLMRREYTLIMEVSNDQKVLAFLNSSEKLEYAELILKIAKLSSTSSSPNNITALDFVGKNPSNLKTRLKFICSKPRHCPPPKWIQFCKTVFLCCTILFSFFFVTEVSFPVSDEELGGISITPENAYFIKNETFLDLYVNNKFFVTVETIPETLEDIPIYDNQQGEF